MKTPHDASVSDGGLNFASGELHVSKAKGGLR